MKYALIALLGLLMVPAVSQAGGHSHWSIGVGFGWSSGGSYVSTSGYYGNGGYYGGGGYCAPRYYAPAPPPVVYYRPAPAYYAPAPVYYAPAPSYYYAPRCTSTYYGGGYCR